MKKLRLLFLILAILLLSPGHALAQAYYFQLPKLIVNVYWNADGTESIDYQFFFTNTPSGHIIDYVDVGLPNRNFDENSITADVDGNKVYDISSSGFQGQGSVGVAVGLGGYSIPPGKSGTVHVYIPTVRDVLYPDQDKTYASADFAPAYYQASVVQGTTDMQITFHLPPGVQPEEPRWHPAPSGWPSQPETGFDDQGRIIYTWHNQTADPSQPNLLGASFPAKYVPKDAIVRTDVLAAIGRFFAAAAVPLLCIVFFAAIIIPAIVSQNRRKLQYLPPKISIEGHGIKRGLTAVEAGILMEQPMDKILTMILFGLIKKNAATVTNREPLEIKAADPLPPDLNPYETDFLKAFSQASTVPNKSLETKKALQTMMVELVRSVSQKMKGFSRKETIAYYKDIMEKAWSQVEASDTPEVKSQKYDENMEWTMLDKDYDDRTRRVFQGGPVFVPIWWPRYDPTFGRPTVSTGGAPVPVGTPRIGGAGTSLPHLPGSDFAASVARGTQTMAASVIGNIGEFTRGITNVTNPPPPPPKTSTTSGRSGGGLGGGGGHSCACACACACAGCACACAGGGR